MYKYSQQSIDAEDAQAVLEVLNSNFLTQGPKIKEFEHAVSDYIGAPFTTCVNSATSALHTVLLGLDVNQNSIVWVPGISFVATANCVEYCGAQLEFLDVDKKTGNLCIKLLKNKLIKSKKLKLLPDVVIIVDMAGRPCELAELIYLSKQFKFKIVHDASHSFGSEYDFQKVGSFEEVAATVFSFHPVKPITTGEGGAICTHDSELDKSVKLISSHYITRENQKDPWMYDQIGLGYNFRMTDIQAALGISQIKKSEKFIKHKSLLAELYTNKLSHLNGVIGLPIDLEKGSRSAHHLYQIRIKSGEQSRRIAYDKLKNEGVLTNVHYRPIYVNSYYVKKYGRLFLKGCETFYKQVLALPLHPELQQEDVDFISSKVEKVCNDCF